MTTTSPQELPQLVEQGQAIAPKAAAQRLPSGFLSLAPTTSTSYPQTPNQRQLAAFLPLTPPTAATEAPAEALKTGDADLGQMKRRTSSLSSSGERSPTGLRFLKLGPVHWGEHQGDHKSDFHDVAVE